MPTRSRVGSHQAWTLEVDPSAWTPVDVDALPADRRDQFLRRRQAITMYLAGETADAILQATGISRSNVYRLIVSRCLTTHADGSLMGWRGALPFLRVRGYERKTAPKPAEETGAGASGALRWLFESPRAAGIEQQFRQQILGKRPKLESARRPKQALFKWLIGKLRDAGFERRGEWPFNVEKLGYVSISRFIDRVMDENPRRQRELLGGPDAQRKARAGDGTGRPLLRLFQRVEADAHKIDARMVVLIPSPHGGYEPRKIHRLWVIVIVEVASRAVLGYHLGVSRDKARNHTQA